jgi:hypothetical protein
MDPMAQMAMHRAHSALSVAIGDAITNNHLKAFSEMRHGIALANSLEEVNFKASAPQALLEFREKFMSLGDTIFSDAPYKALTSAYLAALAPFSVLDSLKRYALVLNPLFPQAILASGYVADEVAEGSREAAFPPRDSDAPKEGRHHSRVVGPARCRCRTQSSDRTSGGQRSDTQPESGRVRCGAR